MRRSPKKIIIIAVLAVLLAVLAFLSFGNEKAADMEYRTFVTKLDQGEVVSVTLEDKTMSFRLKGDDNLYRCDNPMTPAFKEKLLLSGVEVTDQRGDDPVSYAMDMAFNILFFGIVLFLLVKLFSTYRKTFHVVRRSGVSFAQIAGMDDLKKEMLSAVDVLKHPKGYAQKGIRQNKGIILEGLPGNGKTLFAKALAQEAGVNFIATKGADFQSALMSVGAMKIRMLFSKARRHRPCIVFIDEFDSIGERRNYAGSGIDKENNRIITTMLNEMDGFTSNDGVLVIAATNSYSSLDPALIRPGRFDLKFSIGNPDGKTRMELIALYTKTKRLGSDVQSETLSALFDGLSCAAIETVLNEAASIASMEKRDELCMEDLLCAAQKTECRLNVSRRK